MMGRLERAKVKPLLIQYDDPEYDAKTDAGALDYDAFVAGGDADFVWLMPRDDGMLYRSIIHRGQLAIKGVVYHHRGAYLLAQGNALTTSMGNMLSIYGLCQCFIATAGVSYGLYRPSPARLCLRQVRDNRSGMPWQSIGDAFAERQL